MNTHTSRKNPRSWKHRQALTLYLLFPGALLLAAHIATASAADQNTCRMQVGGGAVVDYGQIKRRLLRATEAVVLAARQRTLSVACDQPVTLAVHVFGGDGAADPLAGSRLGVEPDARYGIGTVAGKNIGAVALHLQADSATIDGVPARLIVSSDSGVTWHDAGAEAALRANELVAWSRGDEHRPSSGRVLNVGVRFDTSITAASSLYLGQEARLDGSIHLSAIFL